MKANTVEGPHDLRLNNLTLLLSVKEPGVLAARQQDLLHRNRRWATACLSWLLPIVLVIVGIVIIC